MYSLRFARAFFCLCVAMVTQTLVAADATLLSIGEINTFLCNDNCSRLYSVTAQVVAVRSDVFVAEDATGRALFNQNKLLKSPCEGDILILRGPVYVSPVSEPWIAVDFLDVHGKAPVPAPLSVRLSDLDKPENDLRVVTVSGTVIDISNDEIDSRYKILLLKENEVLLPVSFESSATNIGPALVNANVRLTGIYERAAHGFRKFSGPFIDLDSRKPVEILKPAPTDPLAAPPLERRPYMTPHEVAGLGRRSVSGQILAVWGRNHLMVRERNGRIVNVELSNGVPLPKVGLSALFAGYPTTDLFHLNLTRAQYGLRPPEQQADERPEDITADELVSSNWRGKKDELYHGALLRISGTVRSLQSSDGLGNRILLVCGHQDVPIDVSACPKITEKIVLGSVVSVTGRCLLLLNNWQTDDIFPHIRGFAIVIRTPDDVSILAMPSWWTPVRLLLVIALLLVALIGIYIRNRLLKRLSAVKLNERTQLAVELHDSLSQSLAGLACQISSAKSTPEGCPLPVKAKLTVAEQMLGSCRTELRNCLFDLRNNTMGEKTFDAAIRRTLEPFANRLLLLVRFHAKRSLFSDATVHSVLAIIRELTANAIRHGKATTVKIAGVIDGQDLVFSVSDDGIGFNPDNRPGADEGHFGLDGIRERVERANGSFTLASTHQFGTKAVIRMPLL